MEKHMTKLNKVAMITGAASGIGREVAVRLAKDGCKICLVDINEVLLKELESELSKVTQVIINVGDVTDANFIKNTIDYL